VPIGCPLGTHDVASPHQASKWTYRGSSNVFGSQRPYPTLFRLSNRFHVLHRLDATRSFSPSGQTSAQNDPIPVEGVLAEPRFHPTMNGEWINAFRAVGLLLLVVVTYDVFRLDVIPFPAQLRFHRPAAARKLTIDTLAAEYRKGCPKHQFESIQLLSRSPQMMLISGFMTEMEAEFLVRIAHLSLRGSVLIFLERRYSKNQLSSIRRRPRHSKRAPETL